MYTIEDMRENAEVIREMCEKHRHELTVFGGALGEATGLIDCDEYIEFMDSLSMDTFVGNYFNGLLIPGQRKMFEDILNGKTTMKKHAKMYLSEQAYKIYKKHL